MVIDERTLLALLIGLALVWGLFMYALSSVRSLTALVDDLRSRFDQEQKRADLAVDAVSRRAGGPAISKHWEPPPDPSNPFPGEDMGEFNQDEVGEEPEYEE